MVPEVRIASPCTAAWEKMAGDDRARHCEECGLDVYNFSEMTSAEIRELIQERNGQRLCARIYRRSDGSMLTRDCPVGLRQRVRKVSRRVGMALSAAMSVAAAAQTPKTAPTSPLIQIDQATGASIELTVKDETGAVIPNSKISIIYHSSLLEGQTNEVGVFSVSKLSAGNYQVVVSASGFTTTKILLDLHRGETHRQNVVLEVSRATMGEIEVLDIAPTKISPPDSRLIPVPSEHPATANPTEK